MGRRSDVEDAVRALKAQPLAEMRTIGRALEHLLAEVEALKARLEGREGGGESQPSK